MKQTDIGLRPTTEIYQDFARAFDHFNQTLFEGVLEQCVLTLQRQQPVEGYFLPARYVNGRAQRAHEIALNPGFFATRSTEQIMIRLVHQMVHYFQHLEGVPSRAGYHNAQWADMMEAVGLIPSATRLPGGKRVGQRVFEYPQPNGMFEHAFQALMDSGFRWRWFDTRTIAEDQLLNSAVILASNEVPGARLLDQPMGAASRLELGIAPSPSSGRRPSKYHCSRDSINVWGRRSLKVICGECGFLMVEVLR